MLYTPAQHYADQFYAWEERCRGYFTFEVPVDLEPAFVPFLFHALPQQVPILDDGRRPGLVGTIFSGLKKLLARSQPAQALVDEETIQAFAFDGGYPLHFIAVSFPKGHKIAAVETEQLLIMLSSCKQPVSFEIIAAPEGITAQYVCAQTDTPYLKNQLKAYFPACSIIEKEDALLKVFERGVIVLDFGLREEFMRPLSQPNSFDPDQHLGLFGVLEYLQPGTGAAIQVSFAGCRSPWAESIVRAVSTDEGKPFFEDAPEMVAAAKQKIAAPLYAVCIRAIGSATTEREAERIAWAVGDALVRQSKSAGNSLMPLSDEGYDYEKHLEDVLLRQTHRLGMILNSKELANFAHYPSASVASAKLVRDARKTKAAPAIATGHRLILGANEHQGKETTVSCSSTQRLKHTHIIGSTGVGKSTLLLNMIVQDIAQNNGLCVLDPHGQLIEDVLAHIPEKRAMDVLLIDPADAEYPVGFNILVAHTEIEKYILASDLVAAFKRLSTSWGDQMSSVFANGIAAFVESEKGGTLADLRRFLVDAKFRDALLKTVSDPSILYYWQHEYKLLKTNSVGSILTRLDSFLRPKLIRNMVCQKKGIDFEAHMDEGKIVLVKLSEGLIGAENSYLLGTFITAKIQQAAMARQAKTQEERRDFFLYIDEFHHFSTPSMSSILSGTRKYGLGFVCANQSMSQVNDAELTDAILAAGTRICFRLGEADARKLENGFSCFDSKDLQNLSTGEAIARIEKPEFDFSLNTEPIAASDVPATVQEQIISHSRNKYGTPRQEVEEMLAETMRTHEREEPKNPKEPKRPAPPPKDAEYIPFEEVPKTGTPVPGEKPAPEQKEVKTVPEPNESKPAADVLNASGTRSGKEVTNTPEGAHILEAGHKNIHRTLKQKIREMAGNRGFVATDEKGTPDRKGFVDVSLIRNGYKIAVEVSVTTSAAWELHNVKKCLAAGYDLVVVCSEDATQLEKIRAMVMGNLAEPEQARIMVCSPDVFFRHLDEMVVQEMSAETRVKGWKVKKIIEALSPEETELNRKIVTRVMKKPPKGGKQG